MKKLIRNRVQCKVCGDIIESTHGHDFKYCTCREIFIDGGLNYIRYGANDLGNVINLCEYEEVPNRKDCAQD